MSDGEDYLRRFGIVPVATPTVQPIDPTTTLPEAIRRVRDGTFYQDYDYASGAGLRALDTAAAAMGEFCDRVERGEVRSKRTYAQFCRILGRQPRR